MSFNSYRNLNFNYDALCKSDISETKFTFVWEISKISSRLKDTPNGEYLKSEGFQIQGPGDKVSRMNVKMFPNGETAKERGFISVYLYNESDEVVTTKCTLFVVNPTTGNKIKHGNYGKSEFNSNYGYGWPKCFHRRQLPSITKDDILTLVFEITIVGEKETVELVVDRPGHVALLESYHQKQLSQDLSRLYNTKDNSDITITCGGKIFACHKIILASRSPVFKKMFESDMLEKRTRSVDIKNMTPEVLESLLEYIYTCRPSRKIHMIAKELLAASDQYQIDKLKELCELHLCSNTDVGNCIELLVIGDMYRASILKSNALGFVSQNMEKINISDCKKTLISHPSLLFEVMELLLPKRKKSVGNCEGIKKARLM